MSSKSSGGERIFAEVVSRKSGGGKRTFEHVANQVRGMLSTGQLKPGDQLPPERKLSVELNVSRSALREALRTLEFAGVLELRQGKRGGAFVSSGNPQSLSNNMSDLLRLGNLAWSDLTEARIWIEEIIVRVACERANAKDIRLLEENIRQAEALFDAGELMEKTDTIIEFHNILARATRNPFLVMMNQTITEVLRYFTRRLGSERTREVFKSRRRFMTAFTAGDADAAVNEMERNLKKVHRLYLRLAREAKANAEAASR